MDIADGVTWRVTNLSMGTFTGSTLRTEVSTGGKTTPASQGGTTQVTATFREVTGRGTLRVRYRQSVLSAKAPVDAATRSAGPISSARAPKIVYPPHGVLLPPNLHQLEIQRDRGNGDDLFLVELIGPLLELKLYTIWNT